MTPQSQLQRRVHAAGQCVSCRRPAEKGWRCVDCNRRRGVAGANQRQQRIASRECLICAKPVDRFAKCLDCRQKAAACDLRRRQKGRAA